jgi:hypothetical protein
MVLWNPHHCIPVERTLKGVAEGKEKILEAALEISAASPSFFTLLGAPLCPELPTAYLADTSINLNRMGG